MPAEFRFDSTKSFEENFEDYLGAIEEIDPPMAAIFRANAVRLAEIVRDGERDSSARASFNAAIAEALDALAHSTSNPGRT